MSTDSVASPTPEEHELHAKDVLITAVIMPRFAGMDLLKALHAEGLELPTLS